MADNSNISLTNFWVHVGDGGWYDVDPSKHAGIIIRCTHSFRLEGEEVRFKGTEISARFVRRRRGSSGSLPKVSAEHLKTPVPLSVPPTRWDPTQKTYHLLLLESGRDDRIKRLRFDDHVVIPPEDDPSRAWRLELTFSHMSAQHRILMRSPNGLHFQRV